VLTDQDHVELLEGWIVPQMMHNPLHDATIELLDDGLRPRLPAPWRIRIQSAITTIDSEPEPDLAIVGRDVRGRLGRHPGSKEIAWVVEVADTTLRRDRYKCEIYARAGIPVYWIVNLVERQIEVYTDPTGPDSNPEYRCRNDFGPGDTIALVVGGHEVGRIPVSELLP
jgi:Uma2 family endonuclease